MADGTTTNYGFTLPEVGASEDTWGTKLNQNWTDLDADLDALQDAIDNIELFPAGTLMLFQQTAAPTGWTKQTTHDDKALRVVSGTASSGGSSVFSTAMATPSVNGSISGSADLSAVSVSMSGNISGTTLTNNQIPSHSHGYFRPSRTNANPGSGANIPLNASQFSTSCGAIGANTSSAGGSGSHNHGHNLSGSLSGSANAGNLAISSATAAINVSYVDLIIASKD